MKTYARPPRLFEQLAALMVLAVMGLPSIGHASPFRPTSALVDEACDVAAIDDAIEDAMKARLRCARLSFLQLLDASQPRASEVVATPSPARLLPPLAGGFAPPTPTPWAAGAALSSLLATLIVGWRRARRAPRMAWAGAVIAAAPSQPAQSTAGPPAYPRTRSNDVTRRTLARQAMAP